MPQRKIGRREFLKLAIAAAGAAGLSHFRILNIGGADVAYAGQCGAEAQDLCNPPSAPDDCTAPPVDPDECKIGGGDPDLCSGQPGDPDLQCPSAGNDTCTTTDPDLCDALAGEADECLMPDDLDSCIPGNPSDPDTCDPNPPVWNMDYQCDPTGGDTCTPPPDPDWCDPWVGWVDECLPALGDRDYNCDDPMTDPDICVVGDPDLCEPAFEPDECNPPQDDVDLPNAVKIASLKTRAGTSPVALVAALLGGIAAAATAIRHRLRHKEPAEEEGE